MRPVGGCGICRQLRACRMESCCSVRASNSIQLSQEAARQAQMVMRSWSIPAGQWNGVHVRIHLAFLFLLLFVWLTQSPNADPKLTLLRSLGFTFIVLIS